MSRQISIDNYFKTKSSAPSGIQIMSDNKNVAKKRRSLNLVKTPTNKKSSKNASIVKKETEVICLSSSDDENAPSSQESQNSSKKCIRNDSVDSNSSQATIIYTLTPQTPVKTPRKTPRKTSHIGSSDSFESPGSKKFFSPIKKRNVIKRSPVKRNLAQESFIQPQVYSDDALFSKACEDMDDKSKF